MSSDLLRNLIDQVNSMDCFKGPIGSHKNYIAHIALANCINFFETVKKNREKRKVSRPDKYRRARHFLNAIESLNNIPDYIYYDYVDPSEATKKGCSLFRQGFCARYFIQRQIKNRANAYKHCKTGSDKKGKFIPHPDSLHAHDLSENTIHFRAGMSCGRPLTETIYSFGPTDDDEGLISDAFKFWVGYINGKNDIEIH